MACKVIGHNPKSFKAALNWMWHEANIDRHDLIMLLKQRGVHVNERKISQWVNTGELADWKNWQIMFEVVNDILKRNGMNIASFFKDDGYTPSNLKKLRKKNGIGLDEFANKTNIDVVDLMIYENESSVNERGLSYVDYQNIVKSLNTNSNA